MTLQDDIEAIYKLDAKRTQGEWTHEISPFAPDTQYISVNGDSDPINSVIYDDGVYPIQCDNMEFIAAAPKMVSIIRQLEAEVTECYVASNASLVLINWKDERIKELEANQEWQPIETAPKDGSNFLAYLPSAKKRNYAAAYYQDRKYLHDRAGNSIIATHWKPLPQPPKGV